jgi:3D (Asp-Asp-Asp) domain-containing protein
MHKLLVGALLAVLALASLSVTAEARWYKVTGVRVTWCCTPVENDYPNRAAFLAAVKHNNWGLERSGRYIGYWSSDQSWHYSRIPMNAHGGRLTPYTAAVDPSFIKHGRTFKIDGLPGIYRADDIGPDGKEINLWAGTGKKACNRSRSVMITSAIIWVDP